MAASSARRHPAEVTSDRWLMRVSVKDYAGDLGFSCRTQSLKS